MVGGVSEQTDLTSPEEVSRPILAGHEALIASLKTDERIRALVEALDEAEELWHRRISETLLKMGKPVDQRKIDYTRGYFAGARHYLTGRIDVAQYRLEQSQKESDDSV